MVNHKRHMKLSHANCDLGALVAMIAEGMEDTGGAGPLAHFTEKDAAEKAATAEALIKDVTVDMSERTAELRKAAATAESAWTQRTLLLHVDPGHR
jgi:hypothetical protein